MSHHSVFFLALWQVLPVLQQIDRARHGERTCAGFDVAYCDDLERAHALFAQQQQSQQQRGAAGGNSQTTAQLLADFFRFYAHEFDYHNDVVSVRTGRYLSKEDKGWTAHGMRQAQNEAEDAAAASATSTAANHDQDHEHGDGNGDDGDGDGDGAASAAGADKDAAAADRPHKAPPMRTLFCIEDPFEVTHNLGRMVGRDALHTIRGEFMRAWRILVDGIETPANIFQLVK